MKFNKTLYRRKVLFFKVISAIMLCFMIAAVYHKLFATNEVADDHKTEERIASKYEVSIDDSLFEGSDKRGKNYSLASKTLIKTDDNIYDLATIKGKYALGEENIDIKARNGKMDDGSKLLKLMDNILIEYSGYFLKANHMDIDLIKMSVHTQDKVNVLYNNSIIKADKFKLDTDLNTVHFEGNVYTHFKISDF